KDEGVAILLALGNGHGADGLAARGHGRAIDYLRAVGHIEFKVALVHLRARRVRGILHSKGAHDIEFSRLGLNAHDVGYNRDSFDLLAYVVDLQFDRRGAWRRHAVVGHVLMNGADQVRRLRVVEFETELTFGIGLGASGFFHALT